MSAPRVSILIPTLDGRADLARLLPALAAQELAGDRELLALDSESDDDSVALLEAAGARVESLPRAEFRHGPARNRLAAAARGEFLVFCSQDALPAGPDFLERLLAPFADPRVAGASARVLPHPGDDPLTARTALAAPEAGAASAVRELPPGTRLEDLPDRERTELLRFNNVASCIRRAVFERIPFPDVPFGEDFAWAAEALRAGHRVAFAAEALVHHAHRYTPRQAFERYRVDAAFHRRVHGLRVRPTLFSVLKGVAFELRADVSFVSQRGGWLHLLRAPWLRGAQVLGQYCGTRGWNQPGGSAATRRYS
jgi:rhamnosyltransferase